MTQRSRTRLTVGAASLLAAAWQIGAAPIGLGAGADSRAEPRRAAAGDKRAQGGGGAGCVADRSGADRTADREPEPDQLRYRLPAREGLFRRRDHRHGDVPEQSGARQSRRDRRCRQAPWSGCRTTRGRSSSSRWPAAIRFRPSGRQYFHMQQDYRRHVRAGSGGLRQVCPDRRIFAASRQIADPDRRRVRVHVPEHEYRARPAVEPGADHLARHPGQLHLGAVDRVAVAE